MSIGNAEACFQWCCVLLPADFNCILQNLHHVWDAVLLLVPLPDRAESDVLLWMAKTPIFHYKPLNLETMCLSSKIQVLELRLFTTGIIFSSEIKSTRLVLSVLRYSRFLSNILTKLLSSVMNINGILIPVNPFPCSSCYYIFSSYCIFLVRSTGVYRIVRKIFGRWILKGQMKLRF